MRVGLGWALGTVAALALGACGTDDDSGGSGDIPPLVAKSLTISEVADQGWTVDADGEPGLPLPKDCADRAQLAVATDDRNDVAFQRDVNGPFLTETVSRFEDGTASTALAEGIAAYLSCDGVSFMAGSTELMAFAEPLDLPAPLGEEAKAVSLTVEGYGVNYLANVAIIRQGDVLGTVIYSDLFLLDPTTTQEFFAAAARRLSN